MRCSLFTLVCCAAVGCGSTASPADSAAAPPDSAAPSRPDAAVAPDLVAASMCTAAVEQLLGPIDKVSTGTVTILKDAGGVRTLYVDASAGGINGTATHPRLYLSLETATRANLTDPMARKSSAWDLALKRVVLFSNDGDGGPGQGGATSVAKAFEQVGAADAKAASLSTESFVDADCNAMMDPIGEILTSMSSWYDYDQATMHLTPKAITWIIRGGGGKLYKVAIDDYYASPDGTTGATSGRYKLRVAAL